MAPSFDRLRVRLIQVRDRPAVLAEEQASFRARCGLREDQLVVTNALADDLGPALVEGVDALMIGGAGAYSVTDTFGWTGGLIAAVQACAERAVPLFGSCWGHQFIARALGGRVVHDPDRAEMGSHAIELTEAGRRDELFGAFPPGFFAQMGHHDRVAELPPGAVELARTDVAPVQAFRMEGLPIYGTQFHSELDEATVRQRLITYRPLYPEMADDAAFARVLGALRPSREVDGLLEAFLRRFAVQNGSHT